MSQTHDASSRFIWPPTIYLAAAVLSGLAAWFSPWPFQIDWRMLGGVAGSALVALGLAVAVSAERRFKGAGTPVPPTRPTTAIVSSGIYRHTRNPMYLGMSLVLAGLGLVFNQLWFLLALPVAVFAVTKLAIEREEEYLTKKFGAEYVNYKARVRRWV